MTEPPVHTGVDEVAAHPHQTGHRWLDMLLACSAIAISIISLFVAIQHGKTEEKLVAAASWPFVVANTNIEEVAGGPGSVMLVMTNAGVGPARVQAARILLDGKPVHSHEQLLATCCGYKGGDLDTQLRDGLVDENSLAGVLSPHDSINLLKVQRTPQTATQFARLVNAANTRLTFSACYCSVLGECWITDMSVTSDPRRVKQCRPSPDDYTN